MAVTMSYDDYNFGSPNGPIPLFTINKEFLRTGSQQSIGTKTIVTLNGVLLHNVASDSEAGTGIDDVTDKINALKEAFQVDYARFQLDCNGTIYDGYPIVRSIEFSNRGDDNYVRAANYTIVLEFNRFNNSGKDGFESHGYKQGTTGESAQQETDLTSYGLVSASDEVTIEWYNDNDGGNLTFFGVAKPSIVSIQRSLSAQGMGMSNMVEGNNYSAEERARKWIMDQIDEDSKGIKGLFCVDYNLISEVRTASSNALEGNCTTNITYLLSKDDSTNYIESFEASVERSSDSPLTSIAINGTIQGFSDLDYGSAADVGDCNPPTTNKSAFDYASDAWETIKNQVFSRAQTLFNSLDNHGPLAKGTLREFPMADSVGYNTEGGIITYSLTYNNREEFYSTDALVETIAYNTTHPIDIYASLTVLGRANGPLFQNMGTKTAETRTLSIDAVFQPNSNKTMGIPSAAGTASSTYDALVESYETDILTGANVVYFRNSDDESWEPTLGHYTRSVSWTVGTC